MQQAYNSTAQSPQEETWSFENISDLDFYKINIVIEITIIQSDCNLDFYSKITIITADHVHLVNPCFAHALQNRDQCDL